MLELIESVSLVVAMIAINNEKFYLFRHILKKLISVIHK